MNVFLNDQHDLRSGWKLAAYYATLILIWVASGITFSLVFTRTNLPDDQLTLLALNEVVLFIPAILAPLLMIRFADHRPLKTFGLTFENWQRHLLGGLAVGALMLVILITGCYAFGYLSIGWTARQAPAITLIMTLAVLLFAAAVEELMFRGFPLQVLSEGIGKWPAVVVLSGFFGLVHMNNPNATLLGTTNTILAGVLLSLAYLKARSLWLPYAIHVGWNVGVGFILGMPLSGLDLASLWTTGIAGSDTILGGSYGPEGGLLTTFIFSTAALMVHRRTWN